MKKNLIVLQDGYKECGAASLLSIIRYYHGNISMARLVEMTATDQEGTSFYFLKLAAEKIGMDAIGYKIDDIEKLKEIKKPFICQLISHHYEHFVVVYEIKKNTIIIMDPAVGEKKFSLEEFQHLWTNYILIFSPQKKLINYREEKYLNKILIETIKKNKVIVLDILILSIIFMIVSFVYGLYLEIVLDYVIDTNLNNLLIITFVFACILLLKCITNFFRNELLIYLNQKIDCSCFFKTFQKLLLLPYNYYKNRTTGEIISRINDLIYVKNILSKIILTVCLDVIILISFSIIGLFKNSKLFLILVVIMLIYVILFYLFKPKLKRYTEINQINSAKLNSTLVETISGFETIKNMHLESKMNEQIEEIYIKTLYDSFNYNNISNLEMFMKEIISLVGVLLLQFSGIIMVMNRQITFSSLLTFTFLANYILDSAKNIIDLTKEYFYVKSSIKRANHLFEVDGENFKKNATFTLKGNISLNHLTFGYKEDSKILKNITLQVSSKERVMILGQSGSGKSTILKLLLKYYSVNRDKIYLDKIDLNDYSITNIREQISCISQNEFLFNDTIKNNIIAGQKVSDEKFFEVVKMTYVDEFVKKMFLGYDTILEENGLNLSGGQRQRIILARMLLKESKIILIDEGLNALDINLERKILKNIFSKYSDATIIVVSHRMENVDLFEHVIHFDHGTIHKEYYLPKERLYDR